VVNIQESGYSQEGIVSPRTSQAYLFPSKRRVHVAQWYGVRLALVQTLFERMPETRTAHIALYNRKQRRADELPSFGFASGWLSRWHAERLSI
jgi:hypothetical protein